MRCAGYNNVDLPAAARLGITVLRVPGYSPEAVAEHAMALAQAANRRICKAYIKVRNNNFALDGLLGHNLYGACAGIVGTGRIGAAMARICHGYGMTVLACDQYENPRWPGLCAMSAGRAAARGRPRQPALPADRRNAPPHQRKDHCPDA